MMMAKDPDPERTPLTGATIDATRLALAQYATGKSSGDCLGPVLRRLAAEARGGSMYPEHLLITLKDIWYSLPPVLTLEEPADQTRLLQRVVTMCIEAYYTE